MKPKVIVSVSNDLISDQRVHKSCMTLTKLGWEVLLIGRFVKGSLPLEKRAYRTRRVKLVFTAGALFYAELNIRLFLLLLVQKCRVMHSNDLDTLPANYLASKIKRTKLVYDSHEYFTEVPELVTRPKIQRIWRKIEEAILPHLEEMFTVNESIAALFKSKYAIKVRVLRNMPSLNVTTNVGRYKKDPNSILSNLPQKKIILLQGAGINIQRGAEELLEAMKKVHEGILVVIGSGDVIPFLKELRVQLKLESKVFFFDKMPFEELHQITQLAYLGCTLDKPTNINYELSLPNKLFDYIHAGVPVLASDLKEVTQIVAQHQIGITLKEYSPISIAHSINELINKEELRETLHQNCIIARNELNWENEEKELISRYQSILNLGK